MKNKNLILALAFIFVALGAGAIDFLNFKKNGGHVGNTIVKDEGARATEIAEAWIKTSSPTFRFDGSSLVFVRQLHGECSECVTVTFSFDSAHGGYGDRSGLFVTQVITPHTIEVFVENGRVTNAITDGAYNELTGALAQ